MKVAVRSYQVMPGYASVLEWNLPFEILDPPLLLVLPLFSLYNYQQLRTHVTRGSRHEKVG